MKHSYSPTLALLFAAASVTGCLPGTGKLRGPGAAGEGNSSVVASIEGISESDLARAGMKYWLACDGGLRVEGSPKADKSAVEFAGKDIKNDMTCAMEIKLPAEDAAKLDWDWFGVENGNPLVGLMYGSNKGKVTDRALTLTLYRLYSPKSAQSFSSEVAVSLELAANAEMPQEDKTVASLVCSETESFPGVYKKQEEKNAVLTFSNLKTKDLKGKTCAKIVLLVDNKESYVGEAKDLTFESPKKDEIVKFPKDDGARYVMKAAETTGGSVNVGTIPGGLCLNFEDSECKDQRTVSLGKWPKNYFVAKVMGITQDGEGDTVTFYVGKGPKGFGLLEGTSLDVTAINKAARSAVDSADRKAFSFYKAQISDDLFKTEFNADFVSGKSFSAYEATEEDLEKVMLLHIDEVRIHGMHVVEASELNKMEKAHWMAVVKAKKDAEEKEFIATGFDKYFFSAAAPAKIDNKPAFLNMETLLADMALASPERYRAYALKDGIMAETSCKLAKSDYIAGLSTRHLGAMKVQADADLDGCQIAGAKFTTAVGTGYTFSATLYKFGWFEAK